MLNTIGKSKGKGFAYGKKKKCINVFYKDINNEVYITKYCGSEIILGKIYDSYYFELEYYIKDPSFVVLNRNYKLKRNEFNY